MRARPNLSGDQLVTDYMTRVAQASRFLPKGARMAFVGRVRGLVEREAGPPGTRTDPERVREVLARLGKPEDLVVAERTRIDQGWVKKRAATEEEGKAAASALTGPRMNRPLTARLRPNSDAQPLFGRPAQPEPDGTVIGPDGSVIGTPPGAPGTGTRRPLLRGAGPQRGASPSRGAGPQSAGARTTGPLGAGSPGTGSRSAGSPSAGSPSAGSPGAGSPGAGSPVRRPPGARSPGAAPGSAGPGSTGPRSTGPRRLRSADDSASPPGANPPGTAPRGANPQAPAAPGAGSPGAGTANTGHASPIDWLTGRVPGKRGAGAGTLTASATRLAREHLLETLAILLLGLGGLILPFPFWLIGAIVAMFSKLWDVKDKAVAVVGPLLVTLVAALLAAVFVGGGGNVIVVYFHGLHVAFGALLRVGSVVTAAYLVRRVVRGPRPKEPPWKRITR